MNLQENWSIEITESSREKQTAKHMIVNIFFIEIIENEKLKDSRLKEAMRNLGRMGVLGLLLGVKYFGTNISQLLQILWSIFRFVSNEFFIKQNNFIVL